MNRYSLPLSAVVIARNSERTIQSCLRSLSANNPSEIILVDGDSKDATIDLARPFASKVLSDGGRGKSAARWLGAKFSSEPLVAFVDSDIVLPAHALRTMMSELNDNGCAAISCHSIPTVPSTPSYWEWSSREHALMGFERRTRPFLATACSILRKDVLLQYGFDLAFGGYMDDIDLERRLLGDGLKLCVSKVIVSHNRSDNMYSFLRYRMLLGRVGCDYLIKYGISDLKKFPPLATLYWILYSLAKRKAWMIPYFAADGAAKTLGFIVGPTSLKSLQSETRESGTRGPI